MMRSTEADEKVRVAPSAVGTYLAQIAIVFIVQFAAGKLAEALPIINSGGVGPVWPASGIALAAFLLFGYQVWPGVVAASFLLTLLSSIPPAAAVVYGIGSALAALTGTFLLRRVANFDNSLSRLRDALGLIVLGAFGSSVVSASIGVSVLYAVDLRGWSGFSRAWLIYWLGDSMGILLVTPLVLALPNLRWSHLRARVPELVALLLLLTVACLTIFGGLPLVAVRLHVLAFAVLPFVIWAAIRFGVSGATLSTLLIASIATVETARSSGPFTQNTPFINAVLLDVFFAVLSVSGMTLAAVITEREKAEKERERLVRKQAAMEARLRLAAIVESSDDAIIGKDMDGMITDWNKGAEQLYGYSAGEVIGKPISLIVPPDRSRDFADIMGTLRRGSSLKHYETVHQKKDGTRTEVSLTVSSIKDAEGRMAGASVICHDISERKRQEFVLRESEQRLRVAAEVGRMYAWEWDPATDSVLRSAECASILGLSDNAGIAKDYFSFIHPDDRAGLWSQVNSLTPEDPVYRTQYRRFHPGGALLWLEESGCATFDGDGKMVRLVGMTADITERKRAQEALHQRDMELAEAQRGVSRRLIEAQEKERIRIARDLHDDFGQRLALLTIELELLQQNSPDLPAEVRSRMGELRRQTSEIATDIQSLSHELHSSRLEYVGIVAAMRGFCHEFGEQQKVEIDFRTHDFPTSLPPDISLCLFRVLQEALHNSAKHSGVRYFEVRLSGTSDEVHLSVSDSGVGFDREAAKEARGLGLISMEERLKLLNGTFSIESQHKCGTTIRAHVPLSARNDSIRATG
jgi:PAS domain S-box-containing protein